MDEVETEDYKAQIRHFMAESVKEKAFSPRPTYKRIITSKGTSKSLKVESKWLLKETA